MARRTFALLAQALPDRPAPVASAP
jgi:hypothetical protein